MTGLPKTTKKTVWRLGVAERITRGATRHRHIVRELRIKIGTNYSGEPIWSSYMDRKALCGAAVIPADGDTTEATCAKCRTALAGCH